MKLDVDIDKAATNIKAKNLHAPKNAGQWTAVCEMKDCPATEASSQLHGWKTDGWILCPKHSAEANQ